MGDRERGERRTRSRTCCQRKTGARQGDIQRKKRGQGGRTK